MRAIMYHYVRESSGNYPFFRYLHIDDFRRQLDYFQNDEGFLTKAEFLKGFSTGQVPDKGYVLTFDDGFVDHYRYVLPEFAARGLWGIFYVATLPYQSGRLLDVHRVHHLLGMHDAPTLLKATLDIVSEDMLVDSHVEEFHRYTYVTHREVDDATTEFKRILNYFIGVDNRTLVLDELMKKFSPIPECELIWEIYMTPDQLIEMQNAGMLIGSHTVEHSVMSKLSVKKQAQEIQESFGTLEAILGAKPTRTFCYPHGGFHTFTSDTEKLLEDADCQFSFNVEARRISVSDVRERAQALPRFNCNQFPYGVASKGLTRAANSDA
jgi:peptidoglycan/xylan/chitin deacetylase (PgdA/CDA1 family)